TGMQDSGTTEDGAYTLGGVTNPVNTDVSRNVGAKWFIPNQNEWYKAAFHQPASQGGDVDDYWMFPTATNADPIVATADANGDISNPGANVINHLRGAVWNDQAGNVTTVGSAGSSSASFYGTFDQGGNVWDYYERIVESNKRGVWGGGWLNNPSNARADHDVHRWDVLLEDAIIGFRVATVPDPNADFDRDGDVDDSDLAQWESSYGIDAMGDTDGDGDSDGFDFLTWQRQFTGSLGAAAASTAVPEPAAWVLCLGCFALMSNRRGSRGDSCKVH
ncbi:MAG: hypothetical protein IH898_12235, partial [Planctomycetes bacterium]|nr:hypothetical protein [Planctomycetota bacterium]